MKKAEYIKWLKEQIDYIKIHEGPHSFCDVAQYAIELSKQKIKIEAYENCLTKIESK